MKSLLEWLLALGVLAGVVWVAAPLVWQWLPRGEEGVTLVESAEPALPTGVPPNAQTVPFVMLPDGGMVRVGLFERELKGALPGRLSQGPPLTEEGVFGERHVLPFKVENTRFWVVLDRTAPQAERRVTAIYVQ